MTGSMAEIFAKVESELKFHMDEAGVPHDVQLLVYKCGYDSMRIFAGLDDTKEAVRSALKDELPLIRLYRQPRKAPQYGFVAQRVGYLPAAAGSSREAQI